MGYRNMIFDVMVMNMERQLTELAHERFGKPFEKWDYEIHGNIFDIGYGFKLIGKEQIRQEFNYKAKDEVAALYSIFNDE